MRLTLIVAATAWFTAGRGIVQGGAALLLGATFSAGAGAAAIDAAMLNRIADEGFNHGEVVETAAYLADRIGSRLTNSPGMRAAERWTQEKFRAWGLQNVRAEGFDFGRGWWIESSRIRLVAPRVLELRGTPVAWTPATNGPLTAPIVVAPLRTEQDFAAWKGKVAGKVVLVTWPEAPKDATCAPFARLSETEVAELDEYELPEFDPETTQKFVELCMFTAKIDAFLAEEGAVAWARMSRKEGRLVHSDGYNYHVGGTPKLPGLELAAEDYRRLARLAKGGEVRLEIDSRVRFEDGDHKAYNILADLPGSKPKSGYVMAGAHLDSASPGDGAADNGAGSAVVMEAARILASIGAQPKRTIRFVLWAGEEQGLLGSTAYMEKYLARRPPNADPVIAALGPYCGPETYPVQPLPGYAELAGYFNVDYGSGRIRGIYAEGNLAVVPIFQEWLKPFQSLGVDKVVAKPTGGTDHVVMSRIGLPAFQFVQDPLDYASRLHHTDIDTFDHLRPDDLRQAAVVLAAVLLNAANSDTPLPGKPVPRQPRLTDPFRYPEPSKP